MTLMSVNGAAALAWENGGAIMPAAALVATRKWRRVK